MTKGVNDIDTSLMSPNLTNEDLKLGGSPTVQTKLLSLIEPHSDIFSCSVKGKAMDVPPTEFLIDHKLRETNQNRAASRNVSTEKHDALKVLLDNILHLRVIQPSKATAWSQVHLVWKQNNGGCRFTIDYRYLKQGHFKRGMENPQHERDAC